MERTNLLGVALLGLLFMLPLAPNLEAYRFAIWKSLGNPMKRFLIDLMKLICWRLKWAL